MVTRYRQVMKEIGGYFELADWEKGRDFPHVDGLLLNTGRNALEYILRCLDNVKRVYLPYYTCEVVLEPLKRLSIPWVYYHINDHLEIQDNIFPKKDEFIIVNNYFGIKDAYIETMAKKYGDHIIVDSAQALFAKHIPDTNAFYSFRKFVGVADGGVAYKGNRFNRIIEINETDCTFDHDSHLLKRKLYGAEAGFADFQENEIKLGNQPIKRMSSATKNILDHIDYTKVVDIRRANYTYLHKRLSKINLLPLPEMDSFVCPMVYPFVARKDIDFRKKLIDNRIFVARYWPNVHQFAPFRTEYKLAKSILPLPCDQRYGEHELDILIERVLDATRS